MSEYFTPEQKHEKAWTDYYRNLGSKGGKASGTGGFYESRELAIRAGALGGAKSRRGFKLISDTDTAIDLEALIRIAGDNLREIVWHTDGRVTAKSGSRAKNPKRLYSGKTAYHAVSKLISDNYEESNND